MKHLIIIFLALFVLSCNTQEKQEVVKPQTDPIPKATLSSYPTEQMDFVQVILDELAEDELNSLAQVIIPAGETIHFKENGYKYAIKTPADVGAIRINNQVMFLEGEILLNPDEVQMQVRSFTVEDFKTEWEYSELLPINKKYPLSIKQDGEPMVGYDQVKEYYSEGDMFTVLDKPKYLVEFESGEFYLINNKNQLWRENPYWDK